MNFHYWSGKNVDEIFIRGKEKINEFFISVEEKRRGVAEQ